MITPVAPSTSNINDRLQCRRQKKAEESGATAATTTPMAAAKPSVINAWISMMSSCRHNSSTDGTVSENERQLGGSNREVFSSRCTQALWPWGQTLSAGNLAPNNRRGNSSTTVFRQVIGRKIPAGSVGDHQTSRSESIGFCFRSSQFRHP
jgi:hypothetical protein